MYDRPVLHLDTFQLHLSKRNSHGHSKLNFLFHYFQFPLTRDQDLKLRQILEPDIRMHQHFVDRDELQRKYKHPCARQK